MRLKEPLFGIRASGLHHILHLSLICTMIYIEGSSDLHPPAPDSPTESTFDLIGFYSRANDRL